jgi:hypothetical protein
MLIYIYIYMVSPSLGALWLIERVNSPWGSQPRGDTRETPRAPTGSQGTEGEGPRGKGPPRPKTNGTYIYIYIYIYVNIYI